MDEQWVSPSNISTMMNFTDMAGMGPITAEKWGWWIKQILTPIVVVIGLTGNCLSFIVMKTKSWRHKSYSHYLCALAFFDSLTLINREVKLIDGMKIYANEQSLFSNFGDVACSIYNFYVHLCYLMSSWLIVAMAMERFVAVYFPLKKAYFCTQTGAAIVICTLTMLLTFSQVFRFVMVGNVKGKCGPRDEYLAVYTSIHIYLYQFTLICGLPIGLIVIFNALVLRRIYRVKKLRSKEDRKFSRQSRSASKRHKTTLMLIAISSFYVITLLPSLIISVILHVAIVLKSPFPPVDLFLKITPFNDLFELISDLNYACNFFIYILSGKVFRLELRRLFATNNAYSTSTTKCREDLV